MYILAHAFATSMLQEVAMDTLCIHFPKEREPPTEILRRIWKVTTECCSVREVLLHVETTDLKAQGQFASQFALIMSLLCQDDHRGVDLRFEMRKRVNMVLSRHRPRTKHR